MTPKAQNILSKADGAMWGSKLRAKMNPLSASSQTKPANLQPLVKVGEYALGIPSRADKSLPRISEPQIMGLNIQKHDANKAGTHYDVRIVDSKTGKAYSWAARNLPTNPGDKTLAVLQPTHTESYSTWSGTIPEGYGAGHVQLFSQDKIEVIKAEPQKITFNVYKSNGDTERYAMIDTGGDNWLFHNVTATRTTRPEIPSEKPHYKSIAPGDLDPNKSNEIWAPKLDGAMNVFLLKPDKPIETYSYRPSAKGVNKLIDHTFRLGLHTTKVPTAFKGKTVVLGEVFARDRISGNVLPPSDTSARLLSNVWRSRELQEKAPLDNMIFNVLRYNGKNVSNKPYAEKLDILKRISSAVPQLKMPPLHVSAESKAELLNDVKSGKHPLTSEGVVVYKLDEATPTKAKLQQDYDVYMRGVFPGEGKYTGRAAGGFTYSHKPTGAVTGRVGSGLSDAFRKELFEEPEKYKGQVARVFAQQQLPSGALRMPIFKDIRAEKFAAARHFLEKKAIALTSYQEDLKKRMQGQHGMVVSWGLGSGKTIGSIAAADQFGATKVVAPASLRENFRKELKAYKPKNKFSVESYEHFTKNPEDVKGKTVIFDEAHRLRTSDTNRSQAAQALTDKANKVLLLTGTPIQNKPHEIAPLINIAAGKRVLPTDEKQFNYHYTKRTKDTPGFLRSLMGAKPKDEIHAINLDDFKKRVSPYISYHSNADDPSMPKVNQRTVDVEMSKDQAKTYNILQKQLPTAIRRRMEGSVPTAEKDAPRLNAFLSATRQISNTGNKFFNKGKSEYSPKLKSIVHNVERSPGQSLIYSNYLASGVKPLSEMLTQKNISHGVFTGKIGDRERKSMVSDYNRKKIKALIVSSSGGEGLDLKNTRQVHITEPHWNEAKIEQVVGRSARKGSHDALPQEERNVDVFRYNSLLPARRSGFLWMKKTRPVSADQYLESMSKRKTNLNNEFLNAMQKNAGAGGHALDQAWNRAFSWLTPADYQIMSAKVLSGEAEILKHISPEVMHVNIPHNDNVYEAAYDKINKKIMTIHRAKHTVFNMASNATFGRIRTKKPSPDLLIKKAYPNAVDPVTSYPVSTTNLHEVGKSQGSDMPDPNVQQYRDHEDTTRPGSIIVAQTSDTRRFLRKKAAVGNFMKEYVAPSLVAGTVIGAGVTAATSKDTGDFKKNITKGIGAGIVGDIATAGALYAWHKRKNLAKLAATSVSNLPQTGGSNLIYMSDAPKTQGWVDDARAYRLTDYSEQGNPASISVKQTPMKTRTVPLTLR